MHTNFFPGLILFLLCLACPKAACPQDTVKIDASRAPRIESLKNSDRDILLRQFDEEVEAAYMALYKGETPAPFFYSYKATEEDTIQTLSARLNIRPSTFAIINGITSADQVLDGKTLLLPTVKGLFVPLGETDSSLEILLQKDTESVEQNKYLCYNIYGRDFAFFAGQDFSSTENAFFLDTALVLPVKNYVISSRFGTRTNPFGGCSNQFHRGVDLAVPEGSRVYACKSGKITGTGQNRVYGKWIQIDHGSGMTSFYAHLSFIEDGIKKGRIIHSGELIAKSGSSGLVTGPHLHFEIRLNGNAVNPEAYGNF